MRVKETHLGTSRPDRGIRYIGVSLPTTLEFSRRVLRGIRAFCSRNKGFEPNLLSDRGELGTAVAEATPVIGLVAFSLVPEEVEDLRRRNLPVVLVSHRSGGSSLPRVVNDDHAVGCLGAEHFLSRGYRNLAFVGRVQHDSFLAQEEGFHSRLAEEGCNAPIFNSDPTYEGFRSVINAIRGLPHPVAVMAANDVLARLLVSSLKDPVTEVPASLAVLGVDDDALENALSPVPLSSVRLAGERIGYEAASLVVRLARGEPVPSEPLVIPPVGVVTRASTDTFAVGDAVVVRALRMIRDRMGEIPDVAALVEAVGVPRRTLEARFRKATGRTLAGDLAQSRIHRACELLASTDLSGKEIAYLVGFSEPRMLSIVFRRLTGETPTDYRARVRPGG